jgi:hypothetical protein
MQYSYTFLIISLLVVSIILVNIYTKTVDNFQNNLTNNNNHTWSPDLIKRFNIYQTTMNKNKTYFNLDILQKQATTDEVEQLLETGFWPWPDYLKNDYIEKVWSSPIIKIDPQYALNYAMRLYNQTAARELLAWNTKEGQFLLYGGDLGVTDGMPTDVRNTIKCSTDSNSNSIMEKKVFNGMNLWNGFMNTTTTTVKPEDIPKEMPGFTFVKNPCNPCVALNSPGDFSCPFKLNVRGDNSISNPWKSLWQL